MTRALLGVAAAFAAALGMLAAAAAGARGIAVTGVVILTVVVLTAFATTYRRTVAPAVWTPPPPRIPRPDHEALLRDIGAVQLALNGPRWADTGLRPTLRQLADVLLDARTGYDLADRPDQARRLLGDELYAFLDPARSPRGFDDGPPPSPTDIAGWLTQLEDIA